MSNIKETQERYIKWGLEQGALHVVLIDPNRDLVFDTRTILKCLYGCGDFGLNHTCPSRPGNLSLADWEQNLRCYSWALLIHSHDQKLNQKVAFGLEQMAFVEGYYFAFSFSDCKLCSECAGIEGKRCRFVRQARPALHSVGVDLFATTRRLGLPLRTLAQEGEEENWYSAVFVE